MPSATNNNNKTMIVVWGKPTKLTQAVVNGTLDQESCVKACMDSIQCAAAHIMVNTTTCSMFMYTVLPNITITKTTAANLSVVTFKVSGNDNICPIGENAPTFDNKTASGYIYDNSNPAVLPSKVYYNISFTSNTWMFTSKIVPACKSPFADYIKHSDDNDTCVTIFTVQKSTAKNVIYAGINQTFSSNSCKNDLAGSLAGINYPNDLPYLDWYIKYFAPTLPSTNCYVRIDGIRTLECRADPTTPTCMSPEGFTFTDPYFKNFDNYNWVTNSSARAGSDDDCLVYVLNGNATIQVDVRTCTDKDTLHAFAHICVTPAFQG